MSEKTVLITGSSKGLGESLALVFSQNKYHVILHGRDEKGLKRVEEGVLKNGVKCEVVAGDIASEETSSRLFRAAADSNLDVLINNAGAYLKRPFQEMSPEDFRRIIEINLVAPVRLIQKIFPIFQKKKSGLIVNINSIAGKNSSDGESAYCASKHGLRGFSRSLQFDATRSGVRVIDIYLGAMNTQMLTDRAHSENFISTVDAADSIFRICREYPSMRVTELDLNRRTY